MDFNTYIKVFARNEFKSVVSGGRKFILLILIATVSLWSIGFSSGASKYLKEKMDSPFVKFLKVDIPFQLAQKQGYVDELKKVMKQDSIVNGYDVQGVSFTSFAFESFYTKNSTSSKARKSETAKIRMISSNDKMYDFMKAKGLFKNNQFVDFSVANYSIVVTEEYLNRLGYNDESPAFLDFRFRGVGNEEFSVPVGIAGVVTQLPDKCDILCTEDLFPHIAGYTEYSILDPNARGHLNEYVIYTEKPIQGLKSDLLEFDPQGLEKQSIGSGNPYYVFPYDSNLSQEELESELTKLLGSYQRIYNFNSVGQISDTNLSGVIYDKLIVEMSSLEQVNQLRKLMLGINTRFESLTSNQKKIGLVIDMDVIESRNNFMTFNSVSMILSRVLVLISIGFIIVLVIQTLLQHIDKNAKNLGTLKAFGMSNRIIGLTYVIISFVMISIVYLASAALLYLAADVSTNAVLSLVRLDTGGECLYDFAVLLSYLPFFTILPLLVVAITIWWKIRNETPGDLIYER